MDCLNTGNKLCNVTFQIGKGKARESRARCMLKVPRTGSRYIPEDVMANIPALLEKIIAMPLLREYGRIH